MSHPDYPIPPIPDDPVPYRGTTSFASTRSGRSTWGDITIAGSQSSINLNDLKKSSRHISMQSMVDNLAQEEEWVNNRPPSIPFYPAPYPSHPSTSFVPTQSTSRLVDAHPAHRPFPESNGAARPPPTPLRNKETLDTELRISGFHEILFVGIVVMAQFMCLAGLGQAIAPVKYIASGLGVSSPGEQSWFSAAYSLTTGTFILIAGRWGDILGHKRLFVAGYIFLGIWSGFAGFSAYVHKQIFFDICRAMQGIGSAMLAPNALALLSRAYKPGLKKNLTFALFGAMAPWGFVFGALSGALFAQTTWWPWTFWSYGIAAFALAGASHLIVPTALAKEAQFAGQRQPQRPGFDWTGSVVGVCGLILVNVAWNNGPLYGWGAPHVYFVLIIGLLFLVAFVWVEAHATSPLLPLAAFNGTVVYTMALIGIGWGSFGICESPNLPLPPPTHTPLTSHIPIRDLLHLPLPPNHPSPNAPNHKPPIHPRPPLRSPRRRPNSLPLNPHPRLPNPPPLHPSIPHRPTPHSLPTRPPNLLGQHVRRHRHHAFRNGYVVSGCHDYSLQSYATRTSGIGG